MVPASKKTQSPSRPGIFMGPLPRVVGGVLISHEVTDPQLPPHRTRRGFPLRLGLYVKRIQPNFRVLFPLSNWKITVFLLEIKCSDLVLFSSSEFSLGGVAVVSVRKELKFQTKPLKNIPEMAFFGRLSPQAPLQAGRKAGRIYLRSVDVGERRSKEKTWRVWGRKAAFWGHVWRKKQHLHGVQMILNSLG